MNNSCFGCKERKIGCHTECEMYNKFLEDLEKRKQKEREYKENLNIRLHSEHCGYDKRSKRK